MKNKQRVGLKDIASYTGVSSAAVSLAINNRPGVSTETRRRVHEAVKKLGYEKRSGSARNLGFAGPPEALKSIGFYAFGVQAALGHSYYGAILSGASAATRDWNIRLSFEAFEEPLRDSADLPAHEVDAMMITGRPPRKFIQRLEKERVPYVMVCCSLAHLPGNTIGPENVESSYQVVQYLASLGHQRIAYLGGEPSNPDARERYLGYRWAVDDLGLDNDEGLALLSFFDPEHGASGLSVLFDQAKEFTAVYAASDFLAMGVYHSARDMGLSVPDDLSVVGFDNNSLCETLHPKLTTMGLDRELIGRLAVQRLGEVVASPQAPRVMRVPATLIERNSRRSL